MKSNYLRGFGKVFDFTLRRTLGARSYIALTLIFSILLFGTVFAVTLLPQLLGNDAESAPTLPSGIIICDSTATDADISWASSLRIAPCSLSPSVETADALADAHTLIAVISYTDGAYSIDVLRTDNSKLSQSDAAYCAELLSSAFRQELFRRANIDETLLDGNQSIENSISGGYADAPAQDEQSTDPYESLRSVVSMIVCFLTIMIMYFMILFYGQSTANSVILEKTSKLMDFFLVSVNSSSMILGKVLATALGAIIQVSAWIISACGGWWVGRLAVNALVPDAAASEFLSILSELEGMFSPGGIVIAILTILAGFLLYCSLASIGGALASKPEDLSFTNSIFTMALVASFLLSLYSGGIGQTGMVSNANWLIYVPFTAILVTPGRALTGDITLLQGAVSAILVLLLAFVSTFIAGKLYTLMSFYRGNPPKLSELPALIKRSFQTNKNK